jgi:8-amino-7-oxononanoate synthase
MRAFCSNDYLGLAGHDEVIAALRRGASRYGVGSGGAHMISGHCRVHEQLEEALADFLQRDRVLLFSTGYMVNTGVIHALMGEGGLVCQDALNHASLLDGGWLSRADSQRYAHSSMPALATMLEGSEASHHLIATDGVFSMDGDLAPLPALVSLSRQHRALLMVDDAHGIGCVGAGGRGIIECPEFVQALPAPQGVVDQHSVPLLVGTLGKAFGVSGAFVAGEGALIDYLMQFTRSYMFTTALPPALAEAALCSLQIVRDQPWRRQRLQQLISRFRAAAQAMGLQLTASQTPVQPVILGGVERALRASALLARLGLDVPAIRPPTVPEGSARLRITFSAAHSDEDLDALLAGLEQVQSELAQVVVNG